MPGLARQEGPCHAGPKIFSTRTMLNNHHFIFSTKTSTTVLILHVKIIIPDSGKVELRCLHDYIGITSGIGLKAFSSDSTGLDTKLKANRPSETGFDPFVNFSGVVGSNLFSLGAEFAFDVSTQTLAKYKAGLSFNSDFLIASLTLNDRNTLRASYYKAVNPLTRTAIAAELKLGFANNGKTTFTVGGQRALFPSTLVKARMDTEGKVGALIQQDILKKFYLTISGEVDFRDMNRPPKIGFSMALNP
ncbi:hypothetical protein Dsin_006210 [Dipteronia sinensis]|uniref:Uncharacterized protein n=1 Tax=Dipteronia sinensis TaxID=43782 RepID=A0AAE0AXZ6_9ROSI|nr:hypothetical protein Dsin_006210 [Dipteronia sinensis]